MKKIIILNSHFYSGSSALYESLCDIGSIQGYKRYRTENNYLTNIDLLSITKQLHKKKNKSAVYIDEILKNHQLSTKLDYSKFFLINIIRRPQDVLNFMVIKENINEIFAARYYEYRLRRICEVAKIAPNSILLTFDDLYKEKGMSLIEDIFDLKEKINFKKELLSPITFNKEKDCISLNVMKEADDCYERYNYFLSQQKNIFSTGF